MAFIWTLHVKDKSVAFSVFSAALIYYSPGIFSLYKIVRKCYLYFSGHYSENLKKRDISNSCSGASRKSTKFNEDCEASEHTTVKFELNVDTPATENQNHDNTNESNSTSSRGHLESSEEDILKDDAKIDAQFKCFVWIVSYFAYIVLYSFFPAFVLAFAYPIRILTLFTFISTFMILAVVYLTTFLKKGVTLKTCQRNEDHRYHPFIKCLVWLVLISTLMYFYLLIFAIFYALIFGRASVISSAPLAVLSLSFLQF